ncbi:DnaJ-like subfamily C member 16 [Cucurbita argyrosperma subsp. argyrosperma]|nr:DnaJ-like subfamily C member 16 [Cucurbita argyrosperma subsp. argyrosperma]
MASTIKAYSVPLILFSVAVFYQLVVIPTSFPTSHYDVLGIKRYSPVDEVKEAYEKLSAKWDPGLEVPKAVDFIKVQYAYELLKNNLWKRNYDLFGIDEQQGVLEKIKVQYAGKKFSEISLPLLDEVALNTEDHNLNFITSNDVRSLFNHDEASVIMLYSFGSKLCAQFSDVWKRIVTLLDGVANTAVVELGEAQLAAYFAEKKPTGQLFFRNGLPSLVAFPLGCKSVDCINRFGGELSADDITDWVATTVLHLPRILYYSKDTLGQNFLAKSSPHKVKVIIFSETGERAVPFIRQTAKNYWDSVSFAFVLWREEDSSVWLDAFGVEVAPAMIFLKDPGVKPIVHHGSINSTSFVQLIEQNKQQAIPQLRSRTSMELGCDARGYSRAGSDTSTWYCAIIAGRLGTELNKMRETIRRVKETLTTDSEAYEADEGPMVSPAAVALKGKRLSFTWLDGEAQKKYCFFYISSESSYETCGPRRDLSDVPRLFIVRYKRDATKAKEIKPRSLFDTSSEDLDLAAQLVALYNGSSEISEIVQWISKIIDDGDSKDLPFYRVKSPELVLEDPEPMRFGHAGSSFINNVLKWIAHIKVAIYDRLNDPRIGPVFFLASLLSFGTIWLRKSQPTLPSQPARQPDLPNESTKPSQPSAKEGSKARRRNRPRTASKGDIPPSITDFEPPNAYQMPQLSGSDSE